MPTRATKLCARQMSTVRTVAGKWAPPRSQRPGRLLHLTRPRLLSGLLSGLTWGWGGDGLGVRAWRLRMSVWATCTGNWCSCRARDATTRGTRRGRSRRTTQQRARYRVSLSPECRCCLYHQQHRTMIIILTSTRQARRGCDTCQSYTLELCGRQWLPKTWPTRPFGGIMCLWDAV